MKVNGEMTKLMGKENIGLQVEISMMDIGKMTKHIKERYKICIDVKSNSIWKGKVYKPAKK